MKYLRLGRTELHVSRTSFGALPIQRISFSEASKILRKAYDCGVNFFDTARGYTDSEKKIGDALSDVRDSIIIATKSHATTKEELQEHLTTSLRSLQTDYVDILQLHNPSTLPKTDDREGLLETLREAKQLGRVRFIGITTHRLAVAKEAVSTGLYDTLQFPLSSLASDEDLELVDLCSKADVGLIAMKALAGGLITNVATSFAFLRQFRNVVPIWGIQHMWELDEFLALEQEEPKLDELLRQQIESDRQELSDAFCRGCGYCLPCPVGIPISTAARMSLLLRRAPYKEFLSERWQHQMELIDQCKDCGQCKQACPYHLETPSLLKSELQKYRKFANQVTST